VNIDTKRGIKLPKNQGKVKFITIEKDYEKGYISGRVIRIFHDDIKIYDDVNDDIDDIPNDKLARSCTFYFDVMKERVAFTTSQYFQYSKFCEYFEQLINLHSEDTEFKVILLKDENELKIKLGCFKKITKIKFSFVPNNPGKNGFEGFYIGDNKVLKEANAKVYSQEMEADKKSDEGLKIRTAFMDKVIKGISEGYGKMFVTGKEDDGQVITITSDNKAPFKVMIPDSERTSIPAVVERGKNAISIIIAKLLM